ncbi:MAG TPA: amidophosphoribosyltransferase [Candidatus Dormibacteraeota bacterium]|nr:amidophosphoribosyltransferase [Candidatus Dormibacteraeota bacterium]
MARSFDEEAPYPGGDNLNEKCGVIGVRVRGADVDVARIAYFGLYALQHRGQESAGIAVGDGHTVVCHREMGLIGAIFDEEILSRLSGYVACGHTRYSTTGSSLVVNAQPLLENSPLGDFALAHNGNLTNTEQLRALLPPDLRLQVESDSDVMAKLLALEPGSDFVERIQSLMRRMEGSYSIVMATADQLIAFRDPWGIRPLCIGRLGDGWVVASESCALATVGAEYVREIEPGEIVCIDDAGLRSARSEVVRKPSFCVFEYIYFSRPDSIMAGRSIYIARHAMGRQLAKEHPADADVVMAVPDSAVPGGIGYADESGLPYVEGLIKNRYIGRTFISPDQSMRARGVKLKFNPLVENLRGKRVVVVDDSIVRGTTTRNIVRLIRDAGAVEVHVRITSPPMIHPCFLGVDTASYDELIAANKTVEEIREHIGADSLGYLGLKGLLASTGRPPSDFCTGCLSGRYPEVIAEHVEGDGRIVSKPEPALSASRTH